MTTVKKLINQSRCFEEAEVFNWQTMESVENRKCLCVSITVYDNPSKCILDTLVFAHVTTRQTSEEKIAMVDNYSPRLLCPG